MNINKSNYEEFVLDYLDGNLAKDELSQMKRFLKTNPSIAMELEGLMEIALVPDESVIFHDKESLKREEKKVVPFYINWYKGLFLAAAMLIGLVCFIKIMTTGNDVESIKSPSIVTKPSNHKTDKTIPKFPIEEATPLIEKPDLQPIVTNTKAIANKKTTKKVVPSTLPAQEPIVDAPIHFVNTPVAPNPTFVAPSLKTNPVKLETPKTPSIELPIVTTIKEQKPSTPKPPIENEELENLPIVKQENEQTPAPAIEEPQLELVMTNEPIAMATPESSSKKRTIKVKLFPKLREGLNKEKIKAAFLPESVSAK